MLKKVKENQKKVLSLVLIFTIVFSMLAIIISKREVQAASNRYTYDGNNLNTNIYPGYKEKLDEIKRVHPNWNLIIMETGLDWNQVVIAEMSFASSNSPYSLIQGKGGAWICPECGSKSYDNGSWYHASEATIRYYMDPRNWLEANSSYFLQFMQIGATNVSDQSVYNAIKGTFLDRENGWENAVAINKASRENGANPFYVIARVLQEQGSDGRGSWRIKDENGTYYYNLFNMGATGSSSAQIIANALAYAKTRGWDSVEKCIAGGIQILFSDYINQKQDTIYLNKFDVETYGGLYHQYMQNIEAPKSESALLYSKVQGTDLLNQDLTFVIPVFTGMPARSSDSPETMGETGPRNIRVKDGHSDINVREGRSTSSKLITTIKDGSVVVLSVERYGDGWQKIVLENGTVGYIYFNPDYFEEINDITNCFEQIIITGSDVNLRAGPGSNQAVITTLAYGQQITRIDNTGRYNIDGKIWDRVKLSDGRQGFVAREFIRLADDADNVFTVRATGGLFLRSEPTGTNIRLLPDGSKVTRTEIGDREINGYFWDKVTTPDGAVGYVARAYLRDKNGNVPSGKADPEEKPKTQINTRKDDEKRIIYAEPNVNEEILRNTYGQDIVITKKDGQNIENGAVGNEYIVKIDGESYRVSKLGDVNGDGYVNTGDTFVIKKLIVEQRKIEDEVLKYALDLNNDGAINTGDSYILKRNVMKLTDLLLKD